MEILSCKDLNFRYNGSSDDTLRGVSFSVSPSQTVLVLGQTGSGKSTLLRLLKKEIAPAGTLSGEIKINGRDQSELSLLESTQTIACVTQNPDTQTVTHKVSSELAFGLESLGADNAEILGRVGEMAAYFGIEDIYSKQIDELSGGQKQLCSLCAAVVQAPEILMLDEPAAQLDPIGTSKLFSVLKRLNSELGTTIIIAEHDPREVFEFCGCLVLGKLFSPSETQKTSSNRPLLRSKKLTQILPQNKKKSLRFRLGTYISGIQKLAGTLLTALTSMSAKARSLPQSALTAAERPPC